MDYSPVHLGTGRNFPGLIHQVFLGISSVWFHQNSFTPETVSGKICVKVNLRNRRWGGCVYVYRCFFLFFCFLFFFCPPQKYQTTILGNGWTDFHEWQRGKCSFQRLTEMGARPPIIFWGAKNYTVRAWCWCLESDSELVCWLWHGTAGAAPRESLRISLLLWHCAVTAVALKRHEPVNAFNLVLWSFCEFGKISRCEIRWKWPLVSSCDGDCCVVSPTQDDQLSGGNADGRYPSALQGTQKTKVAYSYLCVYINQCVCVNRMYYCFQFFFNWPIFPSHQ